MFLYLIRRRLFRYDEPSVHSHLEALFHSNRESPQTLRSQKESPPLTPTGTSGGRRYHQDATVVVPRSISLSTCRTFASIGLEPVGFLQLRCSIRPGGAPSTCSMKLWEGFYLILLKSRKPCCFFIKKCRNYFVISVLWNVCHEVAVISEKSPTKLHKFNVFMIDSTPKWKPLGIKCTNWHL